MGFFKMPLIINFRSDRQSASSYLGAASWTLFPLESSFLQTDSLDFTLGMHGYLSRTAHPALPSPKLMGYGGIGLGIFRTLTCIVDWNTRQEFTIGIASYRLHSMTRFFRLFQLPVFGRTRIPVQTGRRMPSTRPLVRPLIHRTGCFLVRRERLPGALSLWRQPIQRPAICHSKEERTLPALPAAHLGEEAVFLEL